MDRRFHPEPLKAAGLVDRTGLRFVGEVWVGRMSYQLWEGIPLVLYRRESVRRNGEVAIEDCGQVRVTIAVGGVDGR
jgi:hypothetical protein